MQWMWNFAPFQVDCIYVRQSTQQRPWSLARADQVCANKTALAGAVRIAWLYGLRKLDEHGYGVPHAMSGCDPVIGFKNQSKQNRGEVGRVSSGRNAITPNSPDRSGARGTGATNGACCSGRRPPDALEVMRVAVDHYARRSGPHRTHLTHEGRSNGCWLVAQRGTGIFLRAGRTLSVPNRRMLVQALGITMELLLNG